MADKIYVGTVGVQVRITMDEDVSNATITKFVVRKPESGEVEWAAVLEGSTILTYTTVSGDLDEAGIYFLHPNLEIGDWTGYGTPINFKIYDKWR